MPVGWSAFVLDWKNPWTRVVFGVLIVITLVCAVLLLT
jgi:hypothetical protein